MSKTTGGLLCGVASVITKGGVCGNVDSNALKIIPP